MSCWKTHLSFRNKMLQVWETRYDEHNCQAAGSCSSGLPANVVCLVGNRSAVMLFSPCSLSLSTKKALAGTSEWVYLVVALGRGWKAHTRHLNSIYAPGRDYPKDQILKHCSFLTGGIQPHPLQRTWNCTDKSEVISVDYRFVQTPRWPVFPPYLSATSLKPEHLVPEHLARV